MNTRTLLALALAGSLVACGDDGKSNGDDAGTTADAGTHTGTDAGDVDAGDEDVDAGDEDASVAPTCSEGPVSAVMQNVEICTDATPVRHVRIANFAAPGTHTSAQFFLGLDAPVGAQAPLADGQFKILFYNLGSSQLMMSYFGDESVDFEGDLSFITTASTLCLDVFPGSATTRALVVAWRDGQGGADCDDLSTLTAENAFGHTWAPSVGELNLHGKAFFYQGAGGLTPVVTLGDTNAIDYSDVPAPECSTAIPAPTANVRSYQELCAVEGAVRHVRMDGFLLANNHATATLLLGQQSIADPTVAPPAATGSQTRVQFYGSTTTPIVTPSVGVAAASPTGDFTFLKTVASTVCFDLHDGSATTPAYFVLWRDGTNGADCDDRGTLTLASAYSVDLSYNRTTGAADKSGPAFLYRSGQSPVVTSVTLSNRLALELTPEDVADAVSCSTDWMDNGNWQQLCRPGAGDAQHFSIEQLNATAASTSRYLYLVLQEPAAPADLTSTPAAPALNDGRLTFNAGRNHLNTSASWFRFNGYPAAGQPTTHALTTDGNLLYTSQPNTVCFDVGRAGAELRVLLWATSTAVDGPDCSDPSTLTVGNAIYDSEVLDTAATWDSSLATGRLNFVKASGNASTTERIQIARVVSRRYLAAL